MKLKLDENLRARGAEILRAAGHDVATVFEQNMSGATDRNLIEQCRLENRCLVTLDLDFGNPLIFNPAIFPGIAVLRLPPRPTPEDLLDTINTLVGALAKSNITGKLWIIQRGRLREYQKPDSAG